MFWRMLNSAAEGVRGELTNEASDDSFNLYIVKQ